jgi:hypothetical protein
MVDLSKDSSLSISKTVRRIIINMKEMFFSENNEQIRN